MIKVSMGVSLGLVYNSTMAVFAPFLCSMSLLHTVIMSNGELAIITSRLLDKFMRVKTKIDKHKSLCR